MLNFNGGSYYAAIKLANPSLNLTLSKLTYESKDITNFRNFVADTNEKIAAYNNEEKHLQIITSKSIFESTAARVGALAFAGILLFFTFFYIFQADYYNLNGVKIIWLWFISLPYLILVYVFWKERE